MQRLVAVHSDIVFDSLGINHAAVRQHDEQLFLEKRRVRIGLRNVRVTALDDGNDGRRVLRVDLDIEGILGVGLDKRSLAAKFHAPHAADFHLILQTRLGDGLIELVFDILRAARHAAGSHAAAEDDFFPPGQFLGLDLKQIVVNHFALQFRICSSAAGGVWRGVTLPS